MLISYRTLRGPGEGTIIIKKSRFIGHARPVEGEEEAVEFIEAIRKRHWDANHNCYAYQVSSDPEIQKSNDAGEPAGTAGRPILEVIKKEALKNVVVVVTRYFGGTLLGAGGLIRAYSQTAGAALQAAGIVTRTLFEQVRVEIEYSWLGRVENETLQGGYFIDRVDYLERVALAALVPAGQFEQYATTITNATSGQALISRGEQVYASVQDGKLVK
jgi:uncharacterized YigZ family protein